MATVLFESVFDQILLKTAKNDRFGDTFSTLRLSLPYILRTIGFFQLSTDFSFIKLGLAKVWLVLVDSKQSYAQKTLGGHPTPPLVQEGLRSLLSQHFYIYCLEFCPVKLYDIVLTAAAMSVCYPLSPFLGRCLDFTLKLH